MPDTRGSGAGRSEYRRKVEALKYVLIGVLCFVCYGNTIQNGYAYDDSVVITENRFTQQGLRGIPDLFQHHSFVGSYQNVPVLERYRPFSLATFAVEHQFFGPDPHIGHFDNVLLFAVTAAALYGLLSKLFANRRDTAEFLDFPLVAVLLFIVHPIHTEVVANIKGRDELLALAGAAAGTLFVLMYLDTHRFRHLALSFCLFLLALFSKENAITFLAIVPLTIFYYGAVGRTDYGYASLPIVAACAIFVGVRWLTLGAPVQPAPEDIITEPFAYASPSGRLATVFYTFGMYVRLLVFPHPLTIDYYPYHIQLTDWTQAAVWLAILAYLSSMVYALWNLSKRSVIAYGILFYVITFFIVSNLPFSVGTFMSERFMFTPSVGFAIVVAWLLGNRESPLRKHRNVLVAAVSLACFCKTFSRNQVWRDDLTLFTTDVETSKNSIKGNLAATVTLLMESQKTNDGPLRAQYRADALTYARRAVSVYRTNVDLAHLKGASYTNAVMLLGNCYSDNDRLAEALGCYREIAASVSNRDELCSMVEQTIDKSDDVDFRFQSYSEFVTSCPDVFSFNYHLGLLYGKERNDLAKAIVYFAKAVEIRPNDVNALRGLGHAYSLSKDYQRAALYFAKLVDLDPGNRSFLIALRDLYGLAGDRAREAEVTKRLGESQAR